MKMNEKFQRERDILCELSRLFELYVDAVEECLVIKILVKQFKPRGQHIIF